MKTPFFSVIIATYNRALLLKRALDSLLKQTEMDWEAVIVDDGSTDPTNIIVESYQKLTDKITYTYQKNSGVILAKNKGISLVRGKYITFLDSDDEYKPNHLSTRKDILLKHSDIDLLHGGVQIIGDQYVPDVQHHTEKIHLSQCAISGTFFIKREVANQLGGFSGSTLGTDADFMGRALNTKLKILKTSVSTYIYHRDSGNSITNNFMY